MRLSARLLAIAVIALAFAPSAGASAPREIATMPAPREPLTATSAPCPGWPEAAGCYEDGTIHISPRTSIEDLGRVLYHERFHAIDERELLPWQREALQAQAPSTAGLPWRPPEGTGLYDRSRYPNELLAERYARCRLHAPPLRAPARLASRCDAMYQVLVP